MLRADDANRKIYSYDDDDPSKGVRIVSRIAHTDNTNDQRIVVPQQIVSVAIGRGDFKFLTAGAGEELVYIAITHLEAISTDYIDVDVEGTIAKWAADAKLITPESKCSRTAEILMRGTLYQAGQATNNGRVVDPYNSPLLADGTYDPNNVKLIGTGPPKFSYLSPRIEPLRRPPRNESEFFALDPIRDLAVRYDVIAAYSVDIRDRGHM